MVVLLHTPLSPFGRLARLVLAEKECAARLVELPLARDAAREVIAEEGGAAAAFAGGIAPDAAAFDAPLGPILIDGDAAIGGATAVIEHLEERGEGRALLPEGAAERGESRRLTEWAGTAFWRAATAPVLEERFLKAVFRTGGPDVARLRAASEAARRLLSEIGPLIDSRGWLAGDRLSLADFALAAQLSVLDYLGDRPFGPGADPVRDAYQIVKSRPAFRGLLRDRSPRLPPSDAYQELDF